MCLGGVSGIFRLHGRQQPEAGAFGRAKVKALGNPLDRKGRLRAQTLSYLHLSWVVLAPRGQFAVWPVQTVKFFGDAPLDWVDKLISEAR